MDNDRLYMERAIAVAERGDRRPGGSPIGCVIVRDETIIGEAYNETERRCDPTAHGEIMAIRQAGQRIGHHELRDATLYTTLQPCGMCTMAIIWAKIGRVVYGAERHQVHPMYFEDRHLTTEDYVRDAYRHDLVFEGGVLAERCAALYLRPGDEVPRAELVNL
jgi:tRNA(adenine34) deaminase